MTSLAKILFILGLLILLASGLVYLAARFQIPLGRLPGDFRIQRENFTCAFPLATSILLSIILTLVLNLLARFLGK